jgi:hypothetical protein
MPAMPENPLPQFEQPRANYSCPECSRAFRTAQGLSGHKQFVHQSLFRKRDPIPAETRIEPPEVPKSVEKPTVKVVNEPAIEIEPPPKVPRPRASPTHRFRNRRTKRYGFNFGLIHF